ncbi:MULTISPECIES: helix-turn-helix transcriptional regulator [unclassified Desulfovibrio]|uniref:helix-turn-helix domain-containing protein n=1 Tax=unclassified Desulfovibrio TaxID=2593640 RepID=UPI001F156E7F|nr:MULTISPECIES: helix-turn-helix transcriptional regulator [unclassified Desulfovibrio]
MPRRHWGEYFFELVASINFLIATTSMLKKQKNDIYFSLEKAAKMPRIDAIVRTFGKNVRAARKSKGLSQDALGATAGLNRTYIGMIERAERSISLSNAKRIADALDMELGALLSPHEGVR